MQQGVTHSHEHHCAEQAREQGKAASLRALVWIGLVIAAVVTVDTIAMLMLAHRVLELTAGR